MSPRVAAHVPDLMDRSRIAGASPDVVFVARADALPEAAAGADVVVVDLSRAGVVEVLPDLAAAGVRVVGFASHVDRPLLAAARAAGCGEVLARSAFFSRLPELLA